MDYESHGRVPSDRARGVDGYLQSGRRPGATSRQMRNRQDEGGGQSGHCGHEKDPIQRGGGQGSKAVVNQRRGARIQCEREVVVKRVSTDDEQ